MTQDRVFKIEKGVLVPPLVRNKQGVGGRNRPVYPFALMDVGDSFYSEIKPSSPARHYANKHGVQFLIRAEGSGYRIWRTA